MDELEQLKRKIFEVETRCTILQDGLQQTLKGSKAATMALSGRIATIQLAVTEMLRAAPAPHELAETLRSSVASLLEDGSQEPNQPYEQELTRTLAAFLDVLEPPAAQD